MRFKLFVLLIVLVLSAGKTGAQLMLSIDATDQTQVKLKSGHLKMGHPGAEGKKIEVNNKYMTLNGNPIIPVMGEMHFSRVAKSEWEDRILKMKACGVTIIASYVFWIHHEEIEGQFDWTANKNLRAFAELCAKHNLWFYPRIGPWCHGEVRNGGTPDWVLQKENLKNRSNDPAYQRYAEEWYKQVAMQLEGLMYKDGGSVIGLQLENEYTSGKGGEAHIRWLKQTAQKYGMDVPIYTVTGWGNSSVPAYEVVPLFGAYPDYPWASNLLRNENCIDFRFSPYRDNEAIGNDVIKATGSNIEYPDYPYFTCEVGVGIENTDHRRLQIGPLDGYGLIMAKIGSGSNLPGYYMFTGGSNPQGRLTSMEENKEEIGYWNTNPVISYDFQAAIRESGELNDSYFEIKKLHYFLNEFGELLAPMQTVLSSGKQDLQHALRIKDNSGFLFGINYCRHKVTTEKKNVQFNIRLKNETLLFPSKPIDVKDSSFFIWPVNLRLHKILLKYATAQPLCVIDNNWIFIQDADNQPEFCFDASGIQDIKASNGKIVQKSGVYIVSKVKPGLQCVITLRNKNNISQRIVVLSREEAKHVWLFKENGRKFLFISDAGMYLNDGKLHLFGSSGNLRFERLMGQNPASLFKTYSYSLPIDEYQVNVTELFPLNKAQWLITGVTELNSKNELTHRFFLKGFSLSNPAKITKASLFILSASNAKIQMNYTWVNQKIIPGSINELDLTGYVRKGENQLLLDFPFEAGQKSFAAKLVIEYSNAERIEINSDTSWLTKDAYNYPSYLSKSGSGFKQPDIANVKTAVNQQLNGNVSYTMSLPESYRNVPKNLYLRINYTGDKAKLFYGHQLIADDFNSGYPWTIGLSNFSSKLLKEDMLLEITPLSPAAKVYFDDEAAKKAATKAALKNVKLVPEHEIIVDIKEILK